MRISRIFLSLLLASAVCAPAATSRSPYVGEETRDIKALSPAEIDGLLKGKGMGLARAAELNGYPGPMHVLELSEELELTADQIASTRALYERMLDSATRLGAEIVVAEKELDELFRSRRANEAALNELMERVGRLRAQVRGVHLAAHIEQTKLLSEDQIARYARLRGYVGGHGAQQGDHSGKVRR